MPPLNAIVVAVIFADMVAVPLVLLSVTAPPEIGPIIDTFCVPEMEIDPEPE